MSVLTLTTLLEFPLVEPGDNLVDQLLASLDITAVALKDDDVLVLAQKIVSKAEGRYGYLNETQPSEAAIELARSIDKDPRLVELILEESVEVIRQRRGVVVVLIRGQATWDYPGKVVD